MKAHVWVMPKPTVLDPQGQTIQHALASLGYAKVKDVRQGKFFVLQLNGATRDEALERDRAHRQGSSDQSRHRRMPLRNTRIGLYKSPSGKSLGYFFGSLSHRNRRGHAAIGAPDFMLV